MSWGKWGSFDGAAAREFEPIPDGVLATHRYCPRCDAVTPWSNDHDHGIRLACHGCGYMIGAPLADDELERAEAYEASPVRLRRQPYKVV